MLRNAPPDAAGRPDAVRPAEASGGLVLASCAAAGIAATGFAMVGPQAGSEAHGAALLCASLAPALFSGFGYLALPRRLGVGTSAVPGLARATVCCTAAAAVAAIAACDGVAGALAPMVALAWLGLACAALDLVATILVGRDRRIHLAELSPLPLATLACGLVLVMVLPIEAGIATRLAVGDRMDPNAGVFGTAMAAPAVPLLLALGLGVAAEVAGACSARVRAAIVAEAGLGCLVWAHLLLTGGGWPAGGAGRGAWDVAVALPALVPVVPVLRGAVRSLARGVLDGGAIASSHAAAFVVLVPLGLLQLVAGGAGPVGGVHGALPLACLFAVFCGFCAWSEPSMGRRATWRDRGLAVQFGMLAVGTVLMLGARWWPPVRFCGETVAALASVWFALTVIAGAIRPWEGAALRRGGAGA